MRVCLSLKLPDGGSLEKLCGGVVSCHHCFSSHILLRIGKWLVGDEAVKLAISHKLDGFLI